MAFEYLYDNKKNYKNKKQKASWLDNRWNLLDTLVNFFSK